MRALVLAMTLAAGAACAYSARPTLETPPGPEKMAELWVEPTDLARRELFHGAGGPTHVPETGARYRFLARDLTGYSQGYDVTDDRGREWSVKLGPEAQTEVVVSRLVWAAGYHQPPVYYVARWTLLEEAGMTPQPAGRFRLELPKQDKVDTWAWHENPFVGTRQLAGLFVLMVMVNNWDLKTSQNIVYDLAEEMEGARRWYVVRDVGASLGRTFWWVLGNRNDVEAFEDEGFIKEVKDGKVEFHYRGAWKEPHLEKNITPADVRWICDRLSRLSPEQWKDAFRAGGYEEEVADRYIRHLQGKVAQGLRLAD